MKLLIMIILVGGVLFMASAAMCNSQAVLKDSVVVLGNDTDVSLNSPLFSIGDEEVGNLSPKKISGRLDQSGLVVTYDTIALKSGGKLDVILRVKWYPKENLLRKYAEYKYKGEKILVKEIILDTIRLNYIPSYNPSHPQSIPVFGKGIFFGVEYPVASVRLEGNNIILAHKPGKFISDGQAMTSKSVVYGLTPLGSEREYFKKYISNNRPFKNELHFNYNSWWTSPVPFNEKDIIDLMDSFYKELYQKNNTNLDTFSIDMGWSKKDDVWVIDKGMFKNEFKTIESMANLMKSNLGLWISPSNFYSPGSFDNNEAMKLGYETMEITWGDGQLRLCCLAGDKYAKRFKDILLYVVKEYGVRQIKLDGCSLTCNSDEHGHMPGDLSSESIADTMVDVCKSITEIAPNTWLEPTCFGYNPSPWWLQYTNSLIGCYGDDSPPGLVPCPVYRESATTGRDFFNLQGAYNLSVPINAQEILGIVHQTNEPFLNDGVMGVLRGNAFVPLYVNPKYMNDLRWSQLGGLINWARANRDILKNTRPIIPKTWKENGVPLLTVNADMPRDIYGYSHWNDKRDENILVLRNPCMFSQEINISLDTDLNLKSGKDYSVVSIYPENRLYFNKLDTDFNIRLAPYETLMLSVGSKNKTKGLDTPKTYLNASSKVSEPIYAVFDGADWLGDDWTSTVGDAVGIIEMPFEIDLDNKADMADLLLCIEGKGAQLSSSTEIFINGKESDYSIISSKSGWTATVLPYREEWNFISVPIESGQSKITGIIRIPQSENVKTIFSAGVVAKKMGGKSNEYINSLPQPEIIYLDGIEIIEPMDLSQLKLKEVRGVRPVKKINGIYLDRLTPDYAQIGWGQLQYNKSILEKDLSVGGRLFSRGLGAHAPASIIYNLDNKYKRFHTYVGCDDENNASVEFIVKLDDKIVWKSGYTTRESGAVPVDLDVSGANKLELLVSDCGNNNGDHVDFCDAYLEF